MNPGRQDVRLGWLSANLVLLLLVELLEVAIVGHGVDSWEVLLCRTLGDNFDEDLHVIFVQSHLHRVHDDCYLVLDRILLWNWCQLSQLRLELILGHERNKVVSKGCKLVQVSWSLAIALISTCF